MRPRSAATGEGEGSLISPRSIFWNVARGEARPPGDVLERVAAHEPDHAKRFESPARDRGIPRHRDIRYRRGRACAGAYNSRRTPISDRAPPYCNVTCRPSGCRLKSRRRPVYEVERVRVAELVRAIVGFPTVVIADEGLLLRTLEIYELYRIHFAEVDLRAPSCPESEWSPRSTATSTAYPPFDGSSRAREIWRPASRTCSLSHMRWFCVGNRNNPSEAARLVNVAPDHAR